MSQLRITYDGVPFIITEKRVYDCHQGTDWHAADKQRRKNAKMTKHSVFCCSSKNNSNYSFHSSNFFIGHVHVRIRWRAFTGPNPSKLKSLLICLYPTIHFY